MASSDSEIAKEFRFFRVYKDGRVELFEPDCEKIQPSDDSTTGVRSKDVVISSEPPVSARIFIPYEAQNPNQNKLPLLFYLRGGGFCRQSAFGPRYHNFCSVFSAQANAIVVSVEYGNFPDRPIPACYEDSWAALNWVASHVSGNGPEPWLNDHADFGKVLIGGASAGGNIAHTLAFRVGTIGLPCVKLVGVIMVHPFFGGTSPEEDATWLYMCPTNAGFQDPRLKPPAEDLARLGCERVLIFVAEKDFLKPVAMNYYEDLKKSGWKGTVELFETHGEGHSFYFDNLKCEKAVELINNCVRSKDVVISSQPTVSARIFIPKVTNSDKQKFPLLLYMHGGGFCTLSAFAKPYHDFCNTVSSQANAIVVSVEYGLFPDRPIPACYEDSWAALKWVASHVSGNRPDPWLNHHADLGRVFIGGDSAGGNIAHTLAFRVGSIGLPGVNLVGVTMVHPFFGGTEDDEMWLYMCASNDGPQDPRMKPPAEDLARLGCERVLIFVAERDYLCPAGKNYYEELKKSGWKGRVELVEHLDEKHVFYLRNPTCTNALERSAFGPLYHNFCSVVSAQANAIVVSVEYKLFPDRPILACYEDSWATLNWVASHAGGNGPEPWLNDHTDFRRVFIGGGSAGGNIAHTLAFPVGSIGLPRVKLVWVIMVHPFFGGTSPEEDEMRLYMCPTNGELQDPRLKCPQRIWPGLGVRGF
ncbi:hypothetical protein WN944_028848 [Citrus x changshan-huyou]|uniref:Alpha/beta hydrolase fold-3 domain-containing protein n=1 Tax=Citrus x changshan-huyou TaxID=2935761 RepID=A0AAP0LPM7_9ROSI